VSLVPGQPREVQQGCVSRILAAIFGTPERVPTTLRHLVGSLLPMSGIQGRVPLAWSQGGDPIDLPEAAVQWRVRRLSASAKGGAPELVYGDDGLPLVVEVGTTAGDFHDAVEHKPGKYRLDALDEQCKAIQGVAPAYVTVSASARAEQSVPFATGDLALRTLADVFVLQSAQVSTLIEACTKLVAAVDAAGVSQREPPPVAIASTAIAVRNGVEQDDDQDDEDDEDEPEAAVEPTVWDQLTKFCASVPPDNLRVCIEGAPDLAANALTKVIQRGVVGLIPIPEDGKRGGS
jgi:hypothetical protein